METIEKSIEVNAPLRAVYNQWTQFEEFPRFMEGVEAVRQLDDKRLFWRAKICGNTEEWEAEIFEQVPDSRIAWRSITGAKNSGQVTFAPLGEFSTRVTLTLGYQPEGVVEKTGDLLGLVSARVEGDLRRFKDFIEERGRETGGWRGEIHGAQVKSEAGGPSRMAS
ncbi:MAG: SRPBCC family protein [Verrucomicrobiales bacterium]